MTHRTVLTSDFARQRAVRLVLGAPDGYVVTKECEQCKQAFPRDNRSTWAYWERARFCSRACVGAARRIATEQNRKPIAEEFARWIDKSGDCWLWTGARDRGGGYGAFSYAGKTRRAHVVALELDGRKPGPGMYACHHCDNPPCVNPKHLYPGTPTQNMADASARGRTCQGSRHHAAKLTDEDVLAIRASPLPPKVIADTYGVCRTNITQIRARKTWSHI